MKRLLTFLSLIFVLFVCSIEAYAQVTYPQGSVPKVIVANLPSPGQSNQLWEVTDGNGTSCTSGGGSTSVFCRWNGVAYAVIGSGGPGTFTTLVTSGASTFASPVTIGVGQTTSATTDLLINPSVKASGNLINAGVASNNAFTVDFAGAIRSGGLFVGNTSLMGSNSRGYFQFPSDGVVELTDNAGTSFNRLQLGGTTSSFPAIKRNGTAINFRLADDSADAAITAGNITSSNAISSTGGNISAAAGGGIFKWGENDATISRAGTTGIQIGAANGANSSGSIKALTYFTDTNCADSAGAAACGSASAGHVVIDAGSTSVVVSTTSVTANSQITPTFDSSLGTRLGITCNTTIALPAITARTAGTSFTITIAVAPITNPACFGYEIKN